MTLQDTVPSPAVKPDPLLADLIEELTAKLQAGEKVDLAAYADAHPGHAQQLRQLLPALQMLAAVGSSAGGDSASASAYELEPRLVSGVLGDYRIIRQIGRGGMGIVYEAEQISLKRRVALKVLPFAAMLDPRQLQRFHNEAQAAACLHHNHIVPVFAVGCDRNLHYYAMQFIDGQSLESLIRELRRQGGLEKDDDQTSSAAPASSAATTSPLAALPTERSNRGRGYFRAAAQLGRQAALALEHAHQQSVVHRDIKPGNLLVDRRGEIWITDFGLARCKGDTELTRTGDLLGTIRYMSPEQAQGKPGLMDHRTDIYSLGATLYELLTLRPVFAGRDRQQLLRQIADQEPRPLRRFNKALPAELEIIVLKALAKHPAERYATAQEMADDLERFLDDKPIKARRPTLRERAARWSRRHKSVVAAGVLVLFMGLSALVVSTLFFLGQRNEKSLRMRKGREIVDGMYVKTVGKWPAHQVHLERAQVELLNEALGYYQEFAREDAGNAALIFDTGKAYHRIADIQHKLGRLPEAKDAFARALAALEQVTSQDAASRDSRFELAGTRNDWADLLRDTDQHVEAEKAYRAARALFAELATEEPGRRDYWDGVAGCSMNLGIVLAAQGRPQDAEKAHREAQTIFRKLVADEPAASAYRYDLALSLNSLASVLRDTGRFQEAEPLYRNALDIFLKLSKEFPDRPVYREALGTSYHSAATLLVLAGRPQEGEKTYQQALALREKLAADFPDVPVYRQAQAVTLNRMGFVLAALGRTSDAERAYRQSLALLEKLVVESADIPAFRRELAASADDLGALLENTRRLQEAETWYARAQALAEKLTADFPGVPEYRLLLCRIYENSGSLFLATARPSEAAQAYERARAAAEKLTADFPAAPSYRGELAWLLATCPVGSLRDPPRAASLAKQVVEQLPENGQAWLVLGVAHFRAGDFRLAVNALQKAAQLARDENAWRGFYLAMARWQAGDRQLAGQGYEQALGWMQRNHVNNRGLVALQTEATALLGR
ncbi:MAG TPA: tetratricopeptide repeat protein [Gemmataceae bacterium]|jgi:serine/threonine protein kinase/Flp pilus assembly protein TadD|nr:tetratricopeptide repeat protein [Gemmataceae bacterium]